MISEENSMFTTHECKAPFSTGLMDSVNSATTKPVYACYLPTRSVSPSVTPRSRHRLWEFVTSIHCSVIGTCLTLAEARKFAVRINGAVFSDLPDLELHNCLVEIASDPDGGARDLHKFLDRRHDLAIRRFDKRKDEVSLVAAWKQALEEGDIPGAYWAVLTHRSATPATWHIVFGDVHMLSHLVGAANRADVRRLTELKNENAELKEKVERQQMRMRDLVTDKQVVIKRLEDQLASRLAAEGKRDIAADASSDAEALDGLVLSLRKQLDQKTARAEALNEQVARLRTTLAQAEDKLKQSSDLTARMADELTTLEIGLANTNGEDSHLQKQLGEFLRGRTIFYCGGRPGNVEAIRRLVESSSGKFLYHDGGQEARIGLLASLLQSADIVLFPVDCVSHNAMGQVKRLCHQSGKPYRALRTSSLGSFMHAVCEESVIPEGPGTARLM